jgi:hypothetical protein
LFALSEPDGLRQCIRATGSTESYDAYFAGGAKCMLVKGAQAYPSNGHD